MNDYQEAYALEGALSEVRRRRVMALFLDWAYIILLSIPAAVIIFFFGIITLTFGWLLYAFMLPIVAIPYVALTMGGPKQATWGMQMAGIRIRRDDGLRVDPFLAIVHVILYWVIHVIGTPFLALVSLFADRKRLLHDLLLGTVVTRA